MVTGSGTKRSVKGRYEIKIVSAFFHFSGQNTAAFFTRNIASVPATVSPLVIRFPLSVNNSFRQTFDIRHTMIYNRIKRVIPLVIIGFRQQSLRYLFVSEPGKNSIARNYNKKKANHLILQRA